MFRTSPRRSTLESLRRVPAFAGLSRRELARIDALMVEIALPGGATLTVEGEIGREAFVVVGGIAEVRIGDRIVGSAGPGDLVGEMALLGDGCRTATVTAVTPMRVYVLDPRQFQSLAAEPHLREWVKATLADRGGLTAAGDAR